MIAMTTTRIPDRIGVGAAGATGEGIGVRALVQAAAVCVGQDLAVWCGAAAHAVEVMLVGEEVRVRFDFCICVVEEIARYAVCCGRAEELPGR